MHSSRMRTARSLTISHSIPGVICPTPLDADPPGCRPFLHADPPWMLTPAGYRPSLDADTSLDADPPFHVTCDACWEANPTPMNRMTHRCKNITLPQTSFAGGNQFNSSHKKSHKVKTHFRKSQTVCIFLSATPQKGLLFTKIC